MTTFTDKSGSAGATEKLQTEDGEDLLTEDLELLLAENSGSFVDGTGVATTFTDRTG